MLWPIISVLLRKATNKNIEGCSNSKLYLWETALPILVLLKFSQSVSSSVFSLPFVSTPLFFKNFFKGDNLNRE